MSFYQIQLRKAQLPKLSQIRIVDFLFKNIDKKPTQTEIARATGQAKSYKNVREVLKELEKQGIVTIQKVGNYKTCSLNLMNHATLNYLVLIEHSKENDLFKKAKYVEEMLNKIVQEILQHTANFSIVLFGSYAKGNYHEHSDVDLIVIADKNKHENIKRTISSIQSIYTKKINYFIVTEKEYAKMIANGNEVNIGTESLKYHIIIYGIEYFLTIVGNVYGKK